MLPWFTALLVGLVVALLVFGAINLLPRVIRTRTMTARFDCPWLRRRVLLRYIADEEHRPVAVISCTAFADPTIVTCARECLGGDGPAGLAAATREGFAGDD